MQSSRLSSFASVQVKVGSEKERGLILFVHARLSKKIVIILIICTEDAMLL